MFKIKYLNIKKGLTSRKSSTKKTTIITTNLWQKK